MTTLPSSNPTVLNLGASTSWKLQGLSRSVQGLFTFTLLVHIAGCYYVTLVLFYETSFWFIVCVIVF